jgi:hypothetical protein
MGGEDALSGLADLQLLSGVLSRRRIRYSAVIVGEGRRLLHLLCDRLKTSWEGVGHAQVGADHVHDGLTMLGVVLGKAFKGVQGAEPDRGFLVAKLLHGLGVQLGDAPLPGVHLVQALAAVGQQQVGRATGTQGDRGACPDRVGL